MAKRKTTGLHRMKKDELIALVLKQHDALHIVEEELANAKKEIEDWRELTETAQRNMRGEAALREHAEAMLGRQLMVEILRLKRIAEGRQVPEILVLEIGRNERDEVILKDLAEARRLLKPRYRLQELKR